MGQRQLNNRDPKTTIMEIDDLAGEEKIQVIIKWRISDPSRFSQTIRNNDEWAKLNLFQLTTYTQNKENIDRIDISSKVNTILQLWFDEYYDYYREKFGVCLVDVYSKQNNITSF